MKLILNHPDHPGYWAVDGNGSWKIQRTKVRLHGKNRYTIVRECSRHVDAQRHVINETWLLDFVARLSAITGSQYITLHEWSEDGNHRQLLDYRRNAPYRRAA